MNIGLSAQQVVRGFQHMWIADSMLLNEMQKQQHRIAQQEEQIQKLEEHYSGLQARLEKLEADIEAGSR